MMLYDENIYIDALSKMDVNCRIVFALTCATRFLPVYESFYLSAGWGDWNAIRAISERLWQHVLGKPIGESKLEEFSKVCEELIPPESVGGDWNSRCYAEDVSASLAYALRTARFQKSQDALRAARRTIELTMHNAEVVLSKSTNQAISEESVLSYSTVQMELSRQKRDLEELSAVIRKNQITTFTNLRSKSEADGKSTGIN